MLEAVTYRYRGHSVADAGLAYRTKDEIAERQAHDPIERVRAQLLAAGAPEDELDAIADARERARAAAVDFADCAAPSRRSTAWRAGMHASGSAEQFERMRPGSPFGEEELDLRRGPGPMSAVADAPTATEVMTYREALRLALREELARDDRVFVMGEEVGLFDGSYKVTAGLLDDSAPTASATRRSPRRASSARASARRCSASARSSRS